MSYRRCQCCALQSARMEFFRTKKMGKLLRSCTIYLIVGIPKSLQTSCSTFFFLLFFLATCISNNDFQTMRPGRKLIFIRNTDAEKSVIQKKWYLSNRGKNVGKKKDRVKNNEKNRYITIPRASHFFLGIVRKLRRVMQRAEMDNFTRGSHDSRSTTTVRETVSILVTVRRAWIRAVQTEK